MSTPDADLATLREDSALLADWAEDEAATPSVAVDNVRARIVGAAERLEAEIARLREERDKWKHECARYLANRQAAERREARLREGLSFFIEAAEEVLELQEPPVEIADVATSAMRAIRDKARALLAKDGAACKHENHHFDRSLCACGSMHHYCDDCGQALESCGLDGVP